MTVSGSRYELLRQRLALFARMFHGVEEGHPSAIHRTRVAARRLREVLPVLQLRGDVASRLGRRLRRVTRRLGTVREIDVLLHLMDGLRRSGDFDEPALSRVIGAIAQDRIEGRARLAARLPAAELQRLAAKLGKVAKGLETDDRGGAATRGWQWAIDARVRHRAEALKGAVDAAGNIYLAGRVHGVRIALKKFRYAVEVKGDVSPDKAWTHELARLKRAQGLLGRLHDRQVLIDRVRQVQASLTPPSLPIWRALDALLNALETECRRLHARYVRDAVGLVALCDRVTGRAVDAPASRRAV